jgi:adenine-specific DNA-methyltransferase
MRATSKSRQALTDANTSIVQRRSGKAPAFFKPLSARLPSVQTLLFQEDCREPAAILESGKAIARTLAEGLDGENRLLLARSFCAAVIETYWFESQRQFRQAWSLPSHFLTDSSSDLTELAAQLANTMGTAAARLDSITASYLIDWRDVHCDAAERHPFTPRSLLHSTWTHSASSRNGNPGRSGLEFLQGPGSCLWRRSFLAPVAAKIAAENRDLSPRQLVKAIADRVRGFEIDPFSAWASQVFLEATVMGICREAGERLPNVVEICNSLLRPPGESAYDLVIGNPPYGRVTLKPEVRGRFQRSLYGHANLYGLFTDLAVQLTRPGGVIAYVTPTSFLAGEYFKALRGLLAKEAPPANLDFVSVRKGVFDDALQETLLATYERKERQHNAKVHFISPVDYDWITLEPAGTFTLPNPVGDPWLIPRTAEQQRLVAGLRKMKHRLSDYGYEVSTGPLVWNRHKKQLAARPAKGTLPLIWAECVTSDGTFVFRAEKKNHEPYFKPEDGDDWLISRKPCVLLQRTTAKEQNRRLIAAELPKSFLSKHGAAVIENHLNMIRPMNSRPAVTPKVLTAFLNTEVVDNAFRCLSGSVAVSAYELEALPLPPPEALAPIAELLKSGAGHRAIEDACSRMFAVLDRA